MFGSREDSEVFRRVVVFVFIDVVDYFLRRKTAAEQPLNNDTMLMTAKLFDIRLRASATPRDVIAHTCLSCFPGLFARRRLSLPMACTAAKTCAHTSFVAAGKLLTTLSVRTGARNGESFGHTDMIAYIRISQLYAFAFLGRHSALAAGQVVRLFSRRHLFKVTFHESLS